MKEYKAVQKFLFFFTNTYQVVTSEIQVLKPRKSQESVGNTPQQELNFSSKPTAQTGQGYSSRTHSEPTALKNGEHKHEHPHLQTTNTMTVNSCGTKNLPRGFHTYSSDTQ